MATAKIAVGGSSEERALSPIRFDGARPPHCPPEPILVYLSVPGSAVVPMRVLESESIASVKLRIQACRGFVVRRQRLVFGGRELARNDCLVRDYGVGDGNVLHLVLRLSGVRAISVRTARGETLELEVDRSRDVGHVKKPIEGRGSGRRLLFDGDGEEGELEDQRVIDDIRKKGGDAAVIHLLIKKTAKVRTRPVEKEFELSVVAPQVPDDVDGKAAAIEELRTREWRSGDGEFWLEPVVGNPKAVLSPSIKDLVNYAFAGLENGHSPVRSPEGSGGAYFMPDASGRNYVAVFKPMDEEPLAVSNPRGLPPSSDGEGLKRGTRVGEGALREVAAYVLDHPPSVRRSLYGDEIGFSGVPPTAMVRCLHEAFHHPGGYERNARSFKIGSLQAFVSNHGSCEDMGPRSFPIEEVHKISVLDLRLANTDRHGGNILFCKEGEEGRIVLVPIDHGYCLPENFEDCTFEWLYWPQARVPYSSTTVDYVESLDAEEDIALLRFHGWNLSAGCARTLRVSTMLLKKGVARGLMAYSIGKILCRETIKKKSAIEEIICEAEEVVLPSSSEDTFMEAVSEIMDRHLDALAAA